jgi:DNA-binding beta-propeller fold protein YncE
MHSRRGFRAGLTVLVVVVVCTTVARQDGSVSFAQARSTFDKVGVGTSAGLALSSDGNTALIGGPGNLTALSPATVATIGSEPVSLVVSPDGKSVYVGFERGTTLAQFSRDPTTGKITALSPATVEAGPEPRTVAISPDGKSVYATNFGGATISQFSRNTETGALTALSPATVATGQGPHGIEVSPDGKSVYAANYEAGSVSQFSRNAETGALTALSPAAVTAGSHPNGIAISFDGKSVYTADRGSETVSQYSRGAGTGLLTALSPATIETGENPHDVAVSRDGKSVYVPNAAETAKTKTVSQFSRNTETGALTALTPATVVTAGEARGVTVSSDGASVYVANGTEGVVSQYSRDATTGLLAQLSPPTVAAGTTSYAVTVSPDGKSAYVTNQDSGNISQYSRVTLPNPSTVATGAASSITQTSATLNATANPNGEPVEDCRFDYGTSNSYGSRVPCMSLPGAGNSPVAVSAPVTIPSLNANTTYHFRIVATNPGGTSYGSDQTFKTLPFPPIAVTGAASSLTQTSATLNAAVFLNRGTVEACHFDYGITTSYGISVPCATPPEAVEVSAPIAGLAAGTTYHFRIVATNEGGTSNGADQALTTLPAATLPQQGLVSQGVLPSQQHKAPLVPDAKLASTSLAVSSSGTVNVNVTCPAGESSCTGTVTLRTLNAVTASATGDQSKKRKAAILTLAIGSFRVAGGQAKAVRLHLSAKARTLLSRTPVLRVRATVVAQDPAGASHTTQTTVTLHTPSTTRHHGKG